MTRTVNLIGCARCHGAGHSQLRFREFQNPVVGPDGTKWTHWATCPTRGEPILMRDGKVEGKA